MKLKGNLVDASKAIDTNKLKLTFLIDNSITSLTELKNASKLDIEVKEYKEKRSLNQNAYMWSLINEMANILRISKDELYLLELKKYSQVQLISVLDTVDVSKFLKYYEECGKSALNGKNFKHYKVFTGSSELNTKEMTILVDGIISDAKELGIETATPEELERMREYGK